MGTDIHTYAERPINGKWEAMRELDNELFGARNYDVFGFLANVRNICAVPAIAAPRGLPDDVSDFVRNAYKPAHQEHTPSWLLASELLNFDYDRTVEDRRVAKQEDPGKPSTCGPGEGRMTTYRELLGEPFFCSLERLRGSGAERLVFFFDN
jgi:hypothetical protein